MASRAIEDLDPRLQPKCRAFLNRCQQAGINAFLTATYRSNLEQDTDYAKGRTAAGKKVTDARAGQSPHNCLDVVGGPCSRGFDFAIKNHDGTLDWDALDPSWRKAIEIGVSLGMTSGSTFPIKDNPHFQMPNWKYVEPWNPASVADLPLV